ncbi:Extracellular calcium-sensing receptor [Trichoplax sp. H2]|nr:Extracellular calcium-sensing receptor [Trichoplax sp. H2]|eukprot:RDD36609.1 Extracellular calcium-sensing receptor [Trichoplax sp. H2]
MTERTTSCFRLAVAINNNIATGLASMLVLSLILLTDSTEIGVSADGQIVLGAVFPIHKQYDAKKQLCSNINWQQIINAQAMIFAIETINEDPYLLPNITLGYDIRDGCDNDHVIVRETLDILFQFSKYKSCEENGRSQYSFSSCSFPHEFSTATTTSALGQAVSNKLAGIIGDQNARGCLDIQGVSKVFNLAQITYGAKESLFSNKKRFPMILRTIPPEDHYPTILESILSYFNWKFIDLLSYVTDLSSRVHEEIQKYLQQKNICIHLSQKVKNQQNSISEAVSKIKTSPAKVVIITATNQYLTSIIQEFEKQNVTGKIIITTGTLESQFFKTSRDIIGGMISISLKHRPSSKFVEYLRKFTLCLSLRPFLSQELENRGFTNFTEQDLEESCGQLLNKIGETKKDIYRNSFSISYVVDAVNALAHSIHKTLNCSNSSCQYEIVNHPSFKN